MTGQQPLRVSGTWVETADGWFAATHQIRQGETDPEIFVYDHEGTGSRQVSPAEVRRIEGVDSEGLYEGHWIPLVSTWTAGMGRVRKPLDRDDDGYLAMLFFDSGPERQAIAALPRAEVHDDRTSNGGISVLVPFSELADYREVVTPIDVPGASRLPERDSPTE